jgi:two-component system NtrC family sensor kinase
MKGTDPGRGTYSDLKVIEKHALRCKKIVGELVMFARDTKTEDVPVDVCYSLGEALASESERLRSREIATMTHGCGDGVVISGDPDRLHQLFVNLISNAADAMENEGGSLDVSIRELEEGPGKACEIVFKDSGAGIGSGDIDKVFDPLFTTKKVGKGSGLGLYICHCIVKEHRGRIWVESPPGEGAAFHIVLPLMPPTRTRGTAPQDTGEDDPRSRV